jgi:hypothetical protein
MRSPVGLSKETQQGIRRLERERKGAEACNHERADQ